MKRLLIPSYSLSVSGYAVFTYVFNTTNGPSTFPLGYRTAQSTRVSVPYCVYLITESNLK